MHGSIHTLCSTHSESLITLSRVEYPYLQSFRRATPNPCSDRSAHLWPQTWGRKDHKEQTHITRTSGGEWVRDRERNRREGDAVHVFNTDLKPGLVPGSVEVVGACNVSELYLICGLMWSHSQWKLNLQELVQLVPANLHETIIKRTTAWMFIQLSQPSWTSLCNSL